MKATAVAHPNIALVKYWGKADEELIIPVAGSMSMTLDRLATTTTVELNDDADSFSLNGEQADETSTGRVSVFLDLVRELAQDRGLGTAKKFATVTSVNEGPTAAGMASSASGFAALATAAAKAYGLDLDTAGLSRLARRGSGSASRSVIDKFAVWNAGHDDVTSFAEEIQAPEMSMIAVTVSAAQKKISSRVGMVRTKESSPYFTGWIRATEKALEDMKAACAAGDFLRIGEITETHAHQMHALINSSEPPIRYLAPDSWAVFEEVSALREEGVECYATADAGPNVVVISRPEDAQKVADRLAKFSANGVAEIFNPGPGAYLVEEAAGEQAGA